MARRNIEKAQTFGCPEPVRIFAKGLSKERAGRLHHKDLDAGSGYEIVDVTKGPPGK